MHKSNIMKNDNAKIQGQFGLCKLSMKFFVFSSRFHRLFLCHQTAHMEIREFMPSNGGTSGDAKTKSGTLFRQVRDGRWGKENIRGKQARVGVGTKKNWLSHDNQSLLTLNLIPWKTLQRYGVPRDNASLRHAFLSSLTSVITKCNLWNAKSVIMPRFHPHYLPFSCWCKEANAFGHAQRSKGGVSWA